MTDEYRGCNSHQRHRRKITQWIERHLAIQTGIRGKADTRHEQSVSIGFRPRCQLHSNIGPGARAVIDDDLNAEGLDETLADQARQDIRAASRWKRDNESDRLGWINFKPRGP